MHALLRTAMADAEKIMPVPKLSDELDESLLPINTDAGAAAWKPLVRAAVRRTRQRLFILFSGTSGISCSLSACVREQSSICVRRGLRHPHGVESCAGCASDVPP